MKTKVAFKSPKNIVLVGLAGCGKSSIGKKLAQTLEIPFADSDYEVELAAGCSMDKIFEIYGENAFRNGEFKVINRLLEDPIKVISTGGNSFLNPAIQTKIQKSSISLWLRADLHTLWERISRKKHRNSQNPKTIQELQVLLDQYYPIYSRAAVHVDTFDEPTKHTVDRVITHLTEHIRENHPYQYVLRSVSI